MRTQIPYYFYRYARRVSATIRVRHHEEPKSILRVNSHGNYEDLEEDIYTVLPKRNNIHLPEDLNVHMNTIYKKLTTI